MMFSTKIKVITVKQKFKIYFDCISGNEKGNSCKCVTPNIYEIKLIFKIQDLNLRMCKKIKHMYNQRVALKFGNFSKCVS